MALAEIPGEWASGSGAMKILNAPHLGSTAIAAPSATSEYMLTGSARRMAVRHARRHVRGADAVYALKAAREGKQETSWLNPHEAYEAGLKAFIVRILDSTVSAEFLNRWKRWRKRVALWVR